MKEKPVFAEIENFNEKLKELCDKKRIAFIDSSDLMSDEYYEQDGIHFKASFYPVWAEKMGGGGRLMSQWKKITIRVMRYVTLLLIVGFVALLLIYTSGSNRPFEKVEKSVEASLDKEI